MTACETKIDFTEIVEAIQNVAEALKKLCEIFIKAVKNDFECFWNALREFLKQTNPKLYRLGYKHKKIRVRKKNQARLWKLFKRLIKYPQ